MSSTASSPEVTPVPPRIPKYSSSIVVRLITEEKVQKVGKKKKAGKKITKAKRLIHDFSPTEENYVGLLNAVLESHHLEEQYEATKRRLFPCKIHVPPAKQVTVSDACDVETYKEFETLAEEILKAKPRKDITLTVQRGDIEKCAKKKGASNDDSDRDSSDQDEDGDDNGLTKLEQELARCRGLLEAKYQNDHDGGYTYVDNVTAESIPLTPFMMKEWSRAIYDGKATVFQPPTTNTFDTRNRQPVLTRNRTTATATPGSSDLAHISQIFSSFSQFAGLARAPDPPSTPMMMKTAVDTPPKNTPTKLSRFLEYAERNLGIENASFFEGRFRDNGYGPDILHLVDHAELRALGLSEGNIIRLKQNAPIWWNGPQVKRKRSDSSPPSAQDFPSTPPNKKIAFEKVYKNQSGSSRGGRSYGPRLTPGQPRPNQDYAWTYFCEARRSMVPIPDGWVPVLEDGIADMDPEDNPFIAATL